VLKRQKDSAWDRHARGAPQIHLDHEQAAVIRLEAVLERAQRQPYAATQGPEQALYAMHTPEAECIGKAKAKQSPMRSG
jgi:hypothetical protein